MITFRSNLDRIIGVLVVTVAVAGCARTTPSTTTKETPAGQDPGDYTVKKYVPFVYVGGREIPKRWYFRHLRSAPPLAVGRSAAVYILDLGCGCGWVRYFSRDGVLLGEFKTLSGSDVAVGPNGDIYTSHRLGEVKYFDYDGSFLGEWYLWPRSKGPVWEFDFVALAIAPSGNVYVAEGKHNRLSYFTASGSFLGKWGRRGSGPGAFKGPNDIAIGPSGTVYVSDSGNGRIQYFTPSGFYLGEWGSKDAPDGRFAGLLSIVVTPAGDVLTADIYKKEIEVFSGTGSFKGGFGIPALQTREFYYRDLAVGPDGTVYVSSGCPGYIWAFKPNKGGATWTKNNTK